MPATDAKVSDSGILLVLGLVAAAIITCALLVCLTLYAVVEQIIRLFEVRAEVRRARRLINRLEELGLDLDTFLEVEELEALYEAS